MSPRIPSNYPEIGRNRIARHSPGRDIVALDGVYAPGRSVEPEFFPLRAPDDCEIAALAQTVALRITALLKRRGLDPGQSHPEDSGPLTRDQPWLADLYAASVSNRIADGPNAGRRVLRSQS